MRSEYHSDELLPLSGIQHFFFCRRQWALIHVERQWQENILTVEGKILHKRVNDPFFNETRAGIITARSVPVASYQLGLTGVCDVVEFTESTEGAQLAGQDKRYLPAPVEYKHGHQKQEPCDEAQLCAQAICLEEMLAVKITQGYLFYFETRRRVAVDLTADLRSMVERMAAEMHSYFQRGYTPRVKTSKACRSCSLADICLPELQKNTTPASLYIRRRIENA